MSLRNRRVREKYCFLLILTSFFLVCVGMVFFLPDLRARTTNGVQDVYEKLPDLFLAPHLPAPPAATSIGVSNDIQGNANLPRPLSPPSSRYLDDRAKLMAKIREEEERNEGMKVLQKPLIVNQDSPSKSSPSSTASSSVSPNVGDGSRNLIAPPTDIGHHAPSVPHGNANSSVVVQGGADSDSLARTRRDFIKQAGRDIFLRDGQGRGLGGKSLSSELLDAQGNRVKIFGAQSADTNETVNEWRSTVVKMTKDAWDNYVKYAWGQNELKPISQRGHSSSIFGPSKIGATIVDAVDTLYIMGLNEEYQMGRDWIAENLDFDKARGEVSVFETNIRFVGGFLSMYSLTGDNMYKEKAYTLAKKLLPAFDTPTGIPYALINLSSGSSKNYGWAASGSSILSEFGTLHLEFTYLSDITGDPIFKEKVYKIREVLKDMHKPKGLYSNYVHPRMGKFTQNHVSMGALGDSFYEYLLKSYLQTGDSDAREMYDEAMKGFEENGLIRYSKSGMLYFAEMKYDRLESKMDHLACFVGGLLALGATTDPELQGGKVPLSESQRATRHLKMAEGVTNTCHESYIRTATRLGPESFRFNDAIEARAQRQNERYYILRPEVIEAYFYLWRITGDPKYREWGWDATQAIEKYCKAGPGGGYSGIRNVYSTEPQQDDVQQTFFFAETLKYLYLMFSSKDLIDFKYWVFNTEAHPLPVKATNPYYRPYQKPPSPSSPQQ
ncbi:unnamed protein product [Allacma fusca]|uniref:mannosyl-oligosaccharide 1,2-alpha-mannosidase n=1 Tax=Allacma fusca TaxID=39272 RepID=A0A8J2KRA5_9HEXA|nr:unnamed protein product [Allacma fusca]